MCTFAGNCSEIVLGGISTPLTLNNFDSCVRPPLLAKTARPRTQKSISQDAADLCWPMVGVVDLSPASAHPTCHCKYASKTSAACFTISVGFFQLLPGTRLYGWRTAWAKASRFCASASLISRLRPPSNVETTSSPENTPEPKGQPSSAGHQWHNRSTGSGTDEAQHPGWYLSFSQPHYMGEQVYRLRRSNLGSGVVQRRVPSSVMVQCVHFRLLLGPEVKG